MKKLFVTLFTIGALVLGGCGDDYDDGKLWDAVNSLDDRVTALESMMSRMNSDINSMSVIVNALQNNVYVTEVTQISEDVYQIVFSNGRTVNISNGKDGLTPYIGENGNWWIGTEDTGVPARGQDGKTPYIGQNGNWWIGTEDTGVQAKGENGVSPHIGQNGHWYIGATDTGIQAKAEDGLTPYIGENGNWWIGTTDTKVKAAGLDGKTPHIGLNGNWWIGSTDLGYSAIATNGTDGLTPFIGENGNWWIGTTDTGVPATGVIASEESGGTETTPVISIDRYNNEYYWVKIINGVKTWLTDSEGNMIPVNGPGAVRPIIRVDAFGYWVISYDGGINFENLTDEYGNWLEYSKCECESFFSSVEVVGNYLVMILKDGTVINIPLQSDDYDKTGIPRETEPNPTIIDPNILLSTNVNYTLQMWESNAVVCRIDMPGIQDPNNPGMWIELKGTGEIGHNVWVSIDDIPHGNIVVEPNTEVRYEADIVFVVDNSGSMDQEANAVAAGIIDWANYLEQQGIDARFACVGYSVSGTINGAIDFTDAQGLSTYLNRATGTSRTMGFVGTNASQLQAAANSGYKVNDECGAMAIRFAEDNLTFRYGVNRAYVNFTDEPNQPNNNTAYSVEYFHNNNSWNGAIHTVFSGDDYNFSNWQTGRNEEPWKMSQYTDGTIFRTTSSFTNVDLKKIPFTESLVHSYFIYITDIVRYMDGQTHKVVITVYEPDGSVRGEIVEYVNFGYYY